MSQQNPHPIDVLAGKWLRRAREARQISRRRFGEMFGMSWQQIQKYEAGTDRMCASCLYHLARALTLPVGYFFDGNESFDAAGKPDDFAILLHSGETRGLMHAYYQIADPGCRRKIHELIRVMAGQPPGDRRRP
jgi:transcriptional regulator with XRE-family HTH domain